MKTQNRTEAFTVRLRSVNKDKLHAIAKKVEKAPTTCLALFIDYCFEEGIIEQFVKNKYCLDELSEKLKNKLTNVEKEMNELINAIKLYTQ